jgi:RNA polymerase sigma-70 factor (ECF subfamily)
VEDRPRAEADLVVRARRGDADACRGLVELHQEVAFRTAYLVLGDAAEAEDATQEAFVKALAALDRFRAGAAFRPWLLAIVANTARNRRRAAARRTNLELRARPEEERRPSEPSPEELVLDAERRREVLDALNRLSADDRLVLGARYFLDLGEAEIAALAGVARGTVKSRLSRARARLGRALGGDHDD